MNEQTVANRLKKYFGVKMNQLRNRFNDELEWLAFCYVNDELRADEQAQFESRLLEDQTAREAVEVAVGQGRLLLAALQAKSGLPASLSADFKVEACSAAGKVLLDTAVSGYRGAGERGNLRWRLMTWGMIAALLLVGLMFSGQLEQLKKGQPNGRPRELAQSSLVSDQLLVDEYLLAKEEYAARLADLFSEVDSENEWDEMKDGLGDWESITLQDHWMLEVFSEIGEPLEETEDSTDQSRIDTKQKDRTWG
jgi:hypothetical protein